MSEPGDERVFEKKIKLEIWANDPESVDRAAGVVLEELCSLLEHGLPALPAGMVVVADLHPDPLQEVH